MIAALIQLFKYELGTFTCLNSHLFFLVEIRLHQYGSAVQKLKKIKRRNQNVRKFMQQCTNACLHVVQFSCP